MIRLQAPFPWFGGKSRVADVVWRAFGPRVNNYVEPFFGSGAVLLGRPGGAGKIETANDIDGMVCNFWRAVTKDPRTVAEVCDWPVNEIDLHARHRSLVTRKPQLRASLEADPDYYDAQVAGWWVWGICQWIGSGWCRESKTTVEAYSPGRLPHIYWAGQGIHKMRLPDLGNGQGTGGKGVHSAENVKLQAIGNNRGIFGGSAPPCEEWFLALANRLRRVRVCCGDWKRVLGVGTFGKGKKVGGRWPCAVFLDPPYPQEVRDAGLYTEDQVNVWQDAKSWALEHGDDPVLRIALCGYAGDFGEHDGWTEYSWRGSLGYAGQDNDNRERERIWFSPHCLSIHQQESLFRGAS